MKFKHAFLNSFLRIYNSRNFIWSSNNTLLKKGMKSTTVEILYEVQTKAIELDTAIYNSRNFIWSSNDSDLVELLQSTTVEILYEVQTFQQLRI